MKIKKSTIPASVRFVHLRPEIKTESKGGVTLAYISDVDQDGNPLTKIAAAFCNPIDNYSKRLGRIKSFGRLTQLMQGQPADDERYFIVAGEDPRAAAEEVAKEICDYTGYVRAHERVDWTNKPLIPTGLTKEA